MFFVIFKAHLQYFEPHAIQNPLKSAHKTITLQAAIHAHKVAILLLGRIYLDLTGSRKSTFNIHIRIEPTPAGRQSFNLNNRLVHFCYKSASNHAEIALLLYLAKYRVRDIIRFI